jgi:hypothetical protein
MASRPVDTAQTEEGTAAGSAANATALVDELLSYNDASCTFLQKVEALLQDYALRLPAVTVTYKVCASRASAPGALALRSEAGRKTGRQAGHPDAPDADAEHCAGVRRT